MTGSPRCGAFSRQPSTGRLHARRRFATSGCECQQGEELKGSLESVLQRVASDGDDDMIVTRLFSSAFRYSAPRPPEKPPGVNSCVVPAPLKFPPGIPGFFQTVISQLDLKTFGLKIKSNLRKLFKHILNKLKTPPRVARARLHALPQQKYEPIGSTISPRPVSDTPKDRNKASHLLLLSLSASTLLPHIRCCSVIFQVFFPSLSEFLQSGRVVKRKKRAQGIEYHLFKQPGRQSGSSRRLL